MASRIISACSRRSFVQATSCSAAAACCAGTASGQDLSRSFLPCTLHPLRKNPADPPSHQERVLELQNTPVPSAPRMPQSHRNAAASPYFLRNAPAQGLARPTVPAQMAAVDRWHKTDLRVFFESNNTRFLDRILELVQQWADLTKLKFNVVNDRMTADIRVGFDMSYGPDGGHWSYIAQESTGLPAGAKTMNLAITPDMLQTDRYSSAVVLHEFGHAVGAGHEHKSPAATSGIRFNEAKTIQYFWQNFRWDEQMTRSNVLEPYRASDLILFSQFDPDSIMLYQYPGNITESGQGTKQNYELSKLDQEFISKLYGQPWPRGDVTTSKTDAGKTPPVSQKLTVDGPRLAGALSPSAAVNTFAFDIAANRTYTVQTDGYTQVVLRLFKGDTEITLDKVRSPDLVNQAVSITLASGNYRVEVSPKHAGGVGEFGIVVKTSGG
jgi:hypothetical protein